MTALLNWLGEKFSDPVPEEGTRAAHVQRIIREDDLNVGRRMSDGTIYVGLSPDTGAPLYMSLGAQAQAVTYDQACDFAANSDADGHTDWRLPTARELEMLHRFSGRRGSLSEVFNKNSWQDGFHWSSTPDGGYAYAQQFMTSDGDAHLLKKDTRISVRLVRG